MATSTNAPTGANAPALSAAQVRAGSTIIPSLGMTFAEGAVKYHALNDDFLRLAHADPTGGDNWPDWMIAQAVKIREAMYEARPQTAADAWAVMNVMACREDEIHDGEADGMKLVRDFLATLAGIDTTQPKTEGDAA